MRLSKLPILAAIRLSFICSTAVLTLTACTEDYAFDDFRTPTFLVYADDLEIVAGQTITWKDSSINATAREWVFEGGMPATATEEMVTVTYAVPGEYVTTVATTFADGSTQTRDIPLTVRQAVDADFSATPQLAQIGVPITFTNATRGVGVIPPNFIETDSSVLYKWYFEGSNRADTVYQHNPVVTYSEAGTYDVSLTVVRRGTNEVDTELKEGYIRIVTAPIRQSRSIVFNRDASAILIHSDAAIGNIPADATAAISLVSADGSSTVAITAIEVPDYADNIIQLKLDAATLEANTEYTLTISDQSGITYADGAFLAPAQQPLYYGGEPQYAAVLYTNFGNTTATATTDGDTYQFIASGAKNGWQPGAGAGITIFTKVLDGYWATIIDANSTYNVTIVPQGPATLDSLRNVAVEISFLGTAGTEYTFNRPVTDLQFHNTFNGSTDMVPRARLSTDGKTLTIVEQGARHGGARISLIVEGPITAEGITVTNTAGQDSNIYVTASGR
jgi:PKD repeat protein